MKAKFPVSSFQFSAAADLPVARQRSVNACPRLYAVPGGVRSLSGPALQEFLRAVIAKNARFRFRARGFSMDPFIQDGDVLTISPFSGPVPQLGDVVAFCHPATQRLVVHRIVAKQSGAFLLRGDNSARADGLIPSEKILGVVTRVEREGKPVQVGFGPERILPAFFSRIGLFFRLRSWRDFLIGFLLKRPGVTTHHLRNEECKMQNEE